MVNHLIHIGYAKAGSSILQRWFAEHPQIAFARSGIAGFATVYDVSKVVASEPGATRLRVTSEESLVTPHATAGDRIIDYDLLAERLPQDDLHLVCDELAQVFPLAWILIVTRGFRDMMLSSYSQYVRTGGTDRFFALDPEFGSQTHRSRHVWHYDRAIDLYERAFPGRVIVLPFELLRDDPEHFVRTLEAKFQLRHRPLPAQIDNPSLSAEELLWYPRLSRGLTRLSMPARLRRRVTRLYLTGVANGALRWLARTGQVLRPGVPIRREMVGDAVLENFRGKADRLRDDPDYRPYAADYLFTPRP